MPIVQSTYRPPVYLLNRHLQTVVPFFYVKPDNTLYKTEKFELPDGDFLELDWIHGGNDKLMIMSHGLEGNSRSSYMQQTAIYFSKLGWDILAINTRGCGREINRLPVRTAFIISVICCLMMLILSVFLSFYTFILSVLLIAGFWLYPYINQHFGLFSNIWVSVCSALAFIYGALIYDLTLL